jgi:hypothetical protein
MNCPHQAEHRCDHTGHERTHRVPEIAPEAIDAYGRRPPGRVRHVAHDRQQRGIDHRGTDAEEYRAAEAGQEGSGETETDDREARRLDEHAPDNQRLPSHAIRQRSGEDLRGAPDDWVDRLDQSDAFQALAVRVEFKREVPPRHAVVQVVDEAGLRC